MSTVTSHFVNALRVRPEVLRVAQDGTTSWTVRVQAAEVLDAVRVECAPGSRIRDIKAAAMSNLLPDVAQLDTWLVKLHGAEVHDENMTLQQCGAQDASTLFLTPRRRRPLR
ncbi:MAG: hypothetical protein IBJ03_04680 [Gemmatimonadaceae bacterium]|nr:hypothetical protein [Gemmatimonadaceae bacterium]